MKKLISILCFLLSAVITLSSSVKLAWDANTETDLAGYRVHYGVESRNYTNSIDVGNVTTFTVTNLLENVTYYFAVTAYNTSGLESEFSNEVFWNNKNVRKWIGLDKGMTNRIYLKTNDINSKSYKFFTNRVYNP